MRQHVEIVHSSVFETRAKVIVNTINTVGVMGAGLAQEFRLRYPDMYADYTARFDTGELAIGRPYLYRESTPWIINFPTKKHWRQPSKLSWVEQGLRSLVGLPDVSEFESVALPLLGCGKGGLDRNEVETMMRKHLEGAPFDYYLCLDDAVPADGVEARMLAFIADAAEPALRRGGLSAKSAGSVMANRPYRRFRDLSRVPGVGTKGYEHLFETAYRLVRDKDLQTGGSEVQLELPL